MSDFTIGSIDFRTPGSGYLVLDKVGRKFTPKLIMRQNPFALVDDQVANVFNDVCVWSVPIRISGAGSTAAEAAADMTAKIAALNAVLTAPNATYQLIDSLDYDGAPETSYTILTSDPILSQRGSGDVEKRHVYDTTIEVRTYPFGSVGSSIDVVPTPDTLTRVGMMALPALDGDLDAQLAVTITGPGLIDAIVAVAPAGADLSDYYFPTLYTGGVGQLATCAVTLAGRFRVLVRASSGTSGTAIGIGQDGATQAYQQTTLSRFDEVAETYDLGEFDADGSTDLQLFICAGHGTISNVVLVPVDVSCVSAWGLPGVGSVVFGANANSNPGQTIGNGLAVPLASPSLLVVVDPPTAEATVSISYSPLVWGWSS